MKFIATLSLAAMALAQAGVAKAADAPAPDAPTAYVNGFPTGMLVWEGSPAGNVPYVFNDPADPSKFIGFELEMMDAIAAHLGMKTTFVSNDWDSLIPGLSRNIAMCAASGIEVSTERAREVDFSVPYYITFEQLVVASGAPEVTSLEQLRGKKVGTLTQTGAIEMLQKAGGIDIKTYDEEQDAYNDVANGRLDAVLLDYVIAQYYARPDPRLKFTGPPFGEVTYAIAVRKGNKEVVDMLNKGIAEIVQDGEMRHILSRWDLWTPEIAAMYHQPAEPDGPPIAYENFIKVVNQSRTFGEKLEQYWRFRWLLWNGVVVTVTTSVFAMLLAVAAGFVLATVRVYGPRPLQLLCITYIEVVRGTPLLIQMVFIFFALPNIGIKLSPWEAGILGLGLNYAAYEAENYRAGLLSVPRGQMEAARALGMTKRQALRHIVIPQAFKLVLPPVTNDFISLLKDSSLVSMITLQDLAWTYRSMASTSFDYFGTGVVVAVIYLLIGLPFVRLARWTEQRLEVDKRPSNQRPGLTPVKYLHSEAKPNLAKRL